MDLLEPIETELAILGAANTGARVGNRSSIARASDDLDETPELAKIGLNPTRRSGQRRLPSESLVSPDGPLPPEVATPA